jgi:hypothetical protein
VPGHATYGWGGGYYYGYGYWPWYDWYYGPWWGLGWSWGWGWPYAYTNWYWGYPPCGTWNAGDCQIEFPGGPATIITEVKPKKAKVLLNGEEIGEARDYNGTWDRLVLRPGRYVVEFAAPGYKTLRLVVSAERGRTYEIVEQLEKGEGLDPRSESMPAAAAAAVGPPGEVASGAALKRGFLRLAVSPGDAVIYLDGEFLARGDEIDRLHGAIAVAQGSHRIEVVRPGFRSRRVDADVQGEAPLEIRIELERED